MEEATLTEILTDHASNSKPSAVLRTNIILSDDDLSDEAKAQFDYHNEILNAFQIYARNILVNSQLSPIGRHLVCTELERNYTNCKSVLNYVAIHPELQTKSNTLPPLLILCGLPRTGTTLLYNLLACDPACRAPLFRDMMYPIPPIARSDTSVRTERDTIDAMDGEAFNAVDLTDYVKSINASHPMFVYEEDRLILNQAGFHSVLTILEPQDSIELQTWFYDDPNKDFAYKYHKTFLRLMNSVDAPRSHWVLKAPLHGMNLDVLLCHHRQVMLVMNHRRLDEVLPSSIRLHIAIASGYFDSNKTNTEADICNVVKRVIYKTDEHTHRLVKFRRSHKNTPVFDVLYDDLLTQPIDTVRRIYEHFGLVWSDDFEMAMAAWLHENPQGKHGRNVYTPDEFGLTSNTIEQRYKEYNSMFLNSQYSSMTDCDVMKSESSI